MKFKLMLRIPTKYIIAEPEHFAINDLPSQTMTEVKLSITLVYI
jgi:hypothetical protein